MKKPTENLSVGFLFDDTLDSDDGVSQYVKRLGGWLSAQGHEVTYLVGGSKLRRWHGGAVISLSKNLKLRWGGNHLSISLVPKLKKIKAISKNKHLDVLHVQVPYSPFMSQIVINKTQKNTAIVGSVHVFPANRLSIVGSRLLKVVYGRSLRRFDTMLSVSSAAQQYARQGFGLDTQISPNIIDVAAFQSIKKPVKKSKQIIFLGRLVERKGCMYLLKAFKLLHNELPDIRLVIAGDGPQRTALEKYVKKNNLAGRVEFRGYIAEADKPSLLASADVACFPSLYGESFGIVLIEAMAAGSGVVVGGNNPGYASVLAGREELLVDPLDTKEFAQRLNKLLSNKELAESLHKWQAAEVKKYDIETVGPQVIAHYREAIASRRKSRHN